MTSVDPDTTDASGSVPRPRPASTGAGAERAVRILDDIFLRASVDGGRWLAGARGVICTLLLVRELVIGGNPRFGPQALTIDAIFVAATTISLFVWIGRGTVTPTAGRMRRLRSAGVIVDAALFFGVMLAIERWPVAHYRGLFDYPYVHFVLLVVGVSALRFGAVYVVASAVSCGVAVVALALIDPVWNPGVEASLDTVCMDLFMIACAAVVATVVASRTRALALRAARRAVDAAHAKEILGAYLGKEIAAEALAVDDVVLGGKRVEVAVLFTDLRAFTSHAEALAPEALVEQLNAYLEAVVRAIVDAGGVVDKYIGDGVMAVFGAPKPRPDDAARALSAIRALLRALDEHNVDRARRNLPPLAQGIGAHFGVAVAGNIGTHDHAQYTLVGDVVNVASRLETMTKEHGASALVSKDLVDAARAHGSIDVDDFTPFGALPVRGRQQPVEVFAFRPPTR